MWVRVLCLSVCVCVCVCVCVYVCVCVCVCVTTHYVCKSVYMPCGNKEGMSSTFHFIQKTAAFWFLFLFLFLGMGNMTK